MPDGAEYWLVVTNIAIGICVFVCLIMALSAVLHDIMASLRRRWTVSHMDREMSVMFGTTGKSHHARTGHPH
jgi:hypothetical protein